MDAGNREPNEGALIPTYSLQRGDRASSPFRFVDMTPRKEGTYDYSRPHRHNYYELFYFAEGSGEHDIDFTTVTIDPPSLHFVSPGQIHEVRRSNDSSGAVLLFTEDFYYLNLANRDVLHETPLLNGNHPRPVLNLDEEEKREVEGTIDRIRKEYANAAPYSDDIIRSLLTLLLITARRIFESRHDAPSYETPQSRLLRELRRAVERHFHAVHAVTAYASMLSVTPGHLNDVVRDLTGRNVSSLIQERITLEAKRLLAHSDHSIKEIAYALGFDDPSYFTRFFRERVGAPPGTFREECLKNRKG